MNRDKLKVMMVVPLLSPPSTKTTNNTHHLRFSGQLHHCFHITITITIPTIATINTITTSTFTTSGGGDRIGSCDVNGGYSSGGGSSVDGGDGNGGSGVMVMVKTVVVVVVVVVQFYNILAVKLREVATITTLPATPPTSLTTLTSTGIPPSNGGNSDSCVDNVRGMMAVERGESAVHQLGDGRGKGSSRGGSSSDR